MHPHIPRPRRKATRTCTDTAGVVRTVHGEFMWPFTARVNENRTDRTDRCCCNLPPPKRCLLGMAAAVTAALGRHDRCGGACALCCRNRRQPESACGSVAPTHHLGDPQRRAVGRGDELCAALAASERGRR